MQCDTGISKSIMSLAISSPAKHSLSEDAHLGAVALLVHLLRRRAPRMLMFEPSGHDVYAIRFKTIAMCGCLLRR